MFGIKKMKERIQELREDVRLLHQKAEEARISMADHGQQIADLKRLLRFETEYKRPISVCGWSSYYDRSNLGFAITVGPHRVCIDANATVTETYNLKAFDIKENACNPPKRRKG